MVPIRSPDHSGPYVGNVPRVTGARCLRTIDPAIARSGTIIKKRPISIAMPSVVFQYVLAPSPAKAEPLLPVADVNAYRISEKPCGPALLVVDVPQSPTLLAA